jgi:hypothetical protein
MTAERYADAYVEHWSAGPFPGRIDPWAEAGHYFKQIHGGVISELLEDYGIQVSMSNKGDPYDNAMMESFFSTLRAELTDLKHFAARQAVHTAVFEFIEVFYNWQRLHSSLATAVH